MALHRNLTGSAVHEPKGADEAGAGEVYVSDGAGSGDWTSASELHPSVYTVMGMYDYADYGTQATAISLTLADTQYQLTNDASGSGTLLIHKLDGLDNVWDSQNDQFVWSGGGVLEVGDTVDLRIDLDITTTSPNTDISLVLELGTGEQLSIVSSHNYSKAGTYNITRMFSIYMGSETTIGDPATLYISAGETGASVNVNGWFVRCLHNVTN